MNSRNLSYKIQKQGKSRDLKLRSLDFERLTLGMEVSMKKTMHDYIRSIKDFPEEGIIFRDITSVLEDADGFQLAVDSMQEKIANLDYDVIVGAESRGFVFAAPLAYLNHKPLVLIRKKGKLPCATVEREYDLEYGSATLEMHLDSIKPGQKVVLVDDLIATGGTTKAMIELVESVGAKVEAVVVIIELAGLNGRELLEGYRLEAAITYSGK